MIKVISSFICSFTAVVLLILCLVTTYWSEWEKTNSWYDTHIMHYRGLWKHCFDIERRNDSWPHPNNKTISECNRLDEKVMIKARTTIVTGLVGLLMLCIALGTPFWYEAAEGSTDVNAGLFETCRTEEDASSSYCGRLEDEEEWIGVVVAFLIIAILVHVVAFIFACIYACYSSSKKFPVRVCAGLFFVAALLIIIALLVYTFNYWDKEIFFSWSYGGGWSVVALDFIAFVLIVADR